MYTRSASLTVASPVSFDRPKTSLFGVSLYLPYHKKKGEHSSAPFFLSLPQRL